LSAPDSTAKSTSPISSPALHLQLRIEAQNRQIANMSFNESMGGSSHEGAKYQPKFKDCKLDEKGGDKTLRRWIALLGSIVMNAVYGKYLEAMGRP